MRALTPVALLFCFIAMQTHSSWAQPSPDNLYCGIGDQPQFGASDGPAFLPKACTYTGLSGTPSPGNVMHVAAGDNLQVALNSAQCGDTIAIQSDATFTGNYLLPGRSCDSGHWIIIRSDAPDSSLPLEGERLTPCYAGVTDLPGRPALSCANQLRVIPQILTPNGSSAILLGKNANHYRLIGLEITRTPDTGMVGSIISVESHFQASHVIFDRLWIHGTAQDDTRSAVSFTGVTYAALIDSYANDFHCTSNTGACTDSHAVAGGVGDSADGPYKVVNNFLEAAAENILLGGGAASTTPADIEIRRNHMFKPLTWMPGNPNFVGGKDGRPFAVKNLSEFKNAQRVLFEGNILENSWGGFSQVGASILLTPKNQLLGRRPKCPSCQVTDVTIRYCRLSHSGAGFQIASALTGAHKLMYQAKAAARYSIHDVIVDDIDATRYSGPGTLFQVFNGWSRNVLNTISINHVTGFGDPRSHLLSLLDRTNNPKMGSFAFSNNLVLAGRYPVWSAGGHGNCAAPDTPAKSMKRCFLPYEFLSNAIIATPLQFPPSVWPSNNFFPASVDAVLFANFASGNGGDYHLLSNSKYKNAGTDGKDLGADVDAVINATQGIE